MPILLLSKAIIKKEIKMKHQYAAYRVKETGNTIEEACEIGAGIKWGEE
jgi:hypothetical protein